MKNVALTIVDPISPKLDSLLALVKSAEMKEAIGQSAENLTRNHFFNLNQERPNKPGGTRLNYWGQAGLNTSHKLNGDGSISVLVKQIGIALHYHGGTVTPVKAKALAIPAIAEAHGRGPRSFANLVCRVFKAGGKATGALVDKTTGTPYFWLVKSTEHKPDKTIIPTEAEFNEAAKEAIESVLANAGK